MAKFQKLDKKQVPQVIGLGVASCGLFGYFALKMIVPTASAAPPPPKQLADSAASSAPVTVASAAPGASTSDPTAAAIPIADAPAPTDSMRNPFAPEVPLTPAADATAAPTVPAAKPATVVNALPSPTTPAMASVPPASLGPLPGVSSAAASGASKTAVAAAPPAAPPWTVTGVLQSGGSQVAILRDGDTRAYSRPGDMVDANFRVVDISRSSVELRHGDQTYTLPLGGLKTTNPAAPQAAPTAAALPPLGVSPTGAAPATNPPDAAPAAEGQ